MLYGALTHDGAVPPGSTVAGVASAANGIVAAVVVQSEMSPSSKLSSQIVVSGEGETSEKSVADSGFAPKLTHADTLPVLSAARACQWYAVSNERPVTVAAIELPPGP